MSSGFDVFIPVGPNDFEIIKYSIKNLNKKIIGYKNINVFSEYRDLNIKNTIDIKEDFFPFTKEEITNLVKNKNRAGWIYQQLVCLYFPYLQNSSEKVLVVDSDVFFTKKTYFEIDNKGIFTTSNENHQPYFDHMSKLHPSIKKFNEQSGISHHMLFDKSISNSMFNLIENYHQKELYKVYIEKLNPAEESPSADYEIYYNYALNFFEDKYILRTLRWSNLEKLSLDSYFNFDMISLPHWKQTRPANIKFHLKNRNFKQALYCFSNYLFLKLLFS